MTAALDHDHVGYETDRLGANDAEPELVVLADGEGLIETAVLLEEVARDHDRRRAHQASPETPAEHLLLLAVPGARVARPTAVDPALLGLGDPVRTMRV